MARTQFIIVAAILVIVLSFPHLWAFACLNGAHLTRLWGSTQIELYKTALKFAPQEPHIRWRVGAGLYHVGKSSEAVDILLPMSLDGLETPEELLLLNAVVASQDSKTAITLYENMPEESVRNSSFASFVALSSLNRTGALPYKSPEFLVATALGMDQNSSDFRLLANRFHSPDFWLSTTGTRTLNALNWRAKVKDFSSKPRSVSGECLHSPEVQLQIAEVLDLDRSNITLGENLVINGGFEELFSLQDANNPTLVQGWNRSYMTNGEIWNRAAFVTGVDCWEQSWRGCSIRVDGLSVEHQPGYRPARVGFWHGSITVEPSSPYLITFLYRTEDLEDSLAALWLSSDSAVLFSGDQPLPSTDNSWDRVIIIAWNQQDSRARIAPILRSYGEGTVWFDDFSICQLRISRSLPTKQVTLRITEVKGP